MEKETYTKAAFSPRDLIITGMLSIGIGLALSMELIVWIGVYEGLKGLSYMFFSKIGVTDGD